MILGDMFELGEESDKEHEQIIKEVISAGIHAILVGEHFFNTMIPHENITYYPSAPALLEALSTRHISERTILIKGSRGMALERTLDYIK